LIRILVTGVSGQIGGALVARLRGRGTIIAADRATLDLGEPQRIAAAFDRLAPQIIINCAAYTPVDAAEEEPELAMVVNAEAPGAMARWAATRSVPLIHFSTDYVFDGSGDKPWREDDPAFPLSAYGASKLAGENSIRAGGGSFLIVRTSWVYASQGRNFLRAIVSQAQHHEAVSVVADQFGAPTSAALIARVIEDIVALEPETLRQRCAQAHGLVHLAALGEASRHGFANSIVQGLKARGVRLAAERITPIATHQYPTRASRPHNSRLDTTRLRKLFGTMLPHWETALAPELDEVAREFSSARYSPTTKS
jgi:dTDP-4-dehydrorhamnose reductase